MWIIAGALLGLVVLAALVGFHSSPHVHVAAGAIGFVAAAWLLVMALDGRSSPGLWALWGADLAVSAGLAVLAWNGLSKRHTRSLRRPLEGAEGVATTDLTPEGIARVGGEDWSVLSVNGTVPAGGRVQVIRAGRVRLEVWGEDVEPPLAGPARSLGRRAFADDNGTSGGHPPGSNDINPPGSNDINPPGSNDINPPGSNHIDKERKP